MTFLNRKLKINRIDQIWLVIEHTELWLVPDLRLPTILNISNGLHFSNTQYKSTDRLN